MSEINVRPAGNFVLVEMVEIKKQSSGGIVFVDVDKEQAAVEVGIVRAIGSTAFIGVAGCNPTDYPTNDPRYKMEPHELWGIKIGDQVQYARYEGQPVKLRDYDRFRYVTDITIKGVIDGSIDLSKTDF